MTNHHQSEHGHEHQHAPRTVERHCDVAVVGGSAAGLSAALQIGRQRRSVIVIDAGEPRNAPAAFMHSYFGHEGKAPGDLLAIGREEVRSYGGEVIPGRVLRVERVGDDRFRLHLAGGHAVVARRVLVATGIVDDLPSIDGLAEHWGRDVIHCPFCHGYEVRDQRIVQIVTHPMGLHATPLFRQLTARLTVVLHDVPEIDDAAVEPLRAAGVDVVRAHVRRVVETDGHVAAVEVGAADGDVVRPPAHSPGSDEGGRLLHAAVKAHAPVGAGPGQADDSSRVRAVELDDGATILADAVAVMPHFHVGIEPFAALGLQATPHISGLGDVVEADMTGATSVSGMYAAGNVTDPSQQVLQAAAQGSRVGGMICFSLAEEDLHAAARPSANAEDWDHRYSGEQLWSGNPNGTLVNEVGELPAGRALDIGAGEGGDAVWLVEHGWQVVANDVSGNGLDRVAAAAVQRAVSVETLLADANAAAPFTPGAFDLVSAQYASIPRTPDQRAVHNILGAVAPGGTLLVVSHDLEPMRVPIDPNTQSRPFDPDAYVRVDDFVAALDDDAGWELERHAKVPRPPGAASAGHHVDDIVLRARRSA